MILKTLHDIDNFRWKFSVRSCKDDPYSMGLEGEELFSYAMVSCIVFSEPPDGIDVSELSCRGLVIQPPGKCDERHESELRQLCENNMCTL
jgi:hypothetical protein